MLEGATEDGDGDTHPALRVPRSSLARAETELRLAETSFIENPESASSAVTKATISMTQGKVPRTA